VVWKILNLIFRLPEIQHGAELILFSYMLICLVLKHLSEFQNQLRVWKYYPIPRALKRKTGFPQSLSLSNKITQFQIHKQQRQGHGFVLLCILTYYQYQCSVRFPSFDLPQPSLSH